MRALTITCVERFTCWRCFTPTEARVAYQTKTDLELMIHLEVPRFCRSCIARDLLEQEQERRRLFGEVHRADT
jgi:hypothetical protein